MKFSSLGSVHAGANPKFLDEALSSIHWQTLKTDEVVFVHDGPLTESLYDCLKKWRNDLPLKDVPVDHSSGFGATLNIGLSHCTHDLIARFDADDINRPHRFKVQVDYMDKNPDVSLVGSDISEFTHIPNDLRRIRRTVYSPEAILHYAQTRNPLNNPSIMIRKKAVLAVGGYKDDIPFMEDYCVCLQLLHKGYRLVNLPDTLVDYRANDDMIARRKGIVYIRSEIKLYRLKRQLGFAKGIQGFMGFLLRALSRLLPVRLLSIVYGFLRKKEQETEI